MADEEAQTPSGKAWPFLMTWVGRATALLGLFASLAGGVTWWIAHHRSQVQRQAQISLANAQTAAGEYQASVATWDQILQSDSLDRTALDGRLNTTLLWVENFSVLTPEGQDPAQTAAPALDQIFPILESGLTRAKGTRAADLQAHLGWAHWLNRHIASREFGAAAEQNLRGALTRDPQNPCAHAMLGNWMLQNGGALPEAVQHLNTAVASAKARSVALPFVRRLQIAALLDVERPGARAALMRAADDIRQSGEPLEPEARHRALVFCCDPMLDRTELVESLSALPPDRVWQTYLWLDAGQEGADAGSDRALPHCFVQANLSEVSGQPALALTQFRQLHQALAHSPGSMSDAVDQAIARLAHAG